MLSDARRVSAAQRSALKKEDKAEKHGRGLGAAATCPWAVAGRPASMTFD